MVRFAIIILLSAMSAVQASGAGASATLEDLLLGLDRTHAAQGKMVTLEEEAMREADQKFSLYQAMQREYESAPKELLLDWPAEPGRSEVLACSVAVAFFRELSTVDVASRIVEHFTVGSQKATPVKVVNLDGRLQGYHALRNGYAGHGQKQNPSFRFSFFPHSLSSEHPATSQKTWSLLPEVCS
ncbi:MAG: hypothetical protein HS115_06965 [Spirochaetales bacterium]|nr:hypothetical protein [Spirochaetales bacterium]